MPLQFFVVPKPFCQWRAFKRRWCTTTASAAGLKPERASDAARLRSAAYQATARPFLFPIWDLCRWFSELVLCFFFLGFVFIVCVVFLVVMSFKAQRKSRRCLGAFICFVACDCDRRHRGTHH